MNKGLEAFKNIELKYLRMLYGTNTPISMEENLQLTIIEKELKAFEIITKYPRNTTSLNYLVDMMIYWEKENKIITKKLLETYDFPYTVKEFNLLKEVLL